MPNPLQILNLEDNINDAELNEAMLSARWPDCHLIRVDNHNDFFLALEANKLDLILSDYTMPGFSGLEALKLARQKRPEVPFLFVSGTIGEDTAIEALKNGATDYVLKHRLMRLIPAVDRALREVAQLTECQRAEEVMRQSEHKYRELFESLEDAAFLVDLESDKVIDVNRSAEAILGCARSGILGRKHSVFLTGKSPAVNELSAPATPAATHECALISAAGATIPVSMHVTHLRLYECSLVLRLCRALPQKVSA